MFAMCAWSGLCHAGVYAVKLWAARTLHSYSFSTSRYNECLKIDQLWQSWKSYLFIIISLIRTTFQSVYNIYGLYWMLGGINMNFFTTGTGWFVHITITFSSRVLDIHDVVCYPWTHVSHHERWQSLCSSVPPCHVYLLFCSFWHDSLKHHQKPCSQVCFVNQDLIRLFAHFIAIMFECLNIQTIYHEKVTRCTVSSQSHHQQEIQTQAQSESRSSGHIEDCEEKITP